MGDAKVEPSDTPVLAPARPPLAVRRPVPEPARAAAQPPLASADALRIVGPIERDLMEDLTRIERETAQQERDQARALVRAVREEALGDRAAAVPRLGAAVIDLGLMAAIGLATIALTLRLCGLSMAQAAILPVVPLTGFVALLAIVYMLLFTAASGQTIGKMLVGLKVVGPAESGAAGAPLTIGRAAARAMLTLPTVATLGLGWLPACFGERLALHDRLAHTRVVRA
jgi:uncharacterized RDD family membrane protein YckC